MAETNNIRLELAQLPEKDNPQAVVIATMSKEGQSRQGIGASSQITIGGAYNPQILIDKAVQQAIERATGALAMPPDSPFRQACNAQVQPGTEANHRGYGRAGAFEGQHRQEAGSMTHGQRRLLEDNAAKLHTSLRELALETFQIEADKLSSQQAHQLIGKMKSERPHR